MQVRETKTIPSVCFKQDEREQERPQQTTCQTKLTITLTEERRGEESKPK